MVRNVVIYPSANISTQHTGSGYSSVSDTRGQYDATAITHQLRASNTTMVSTYRCTPKTADAPIGKVRIKSITRGEIYSRLVSSENNSQTASIVAAASIGGSSFIDGTPAVRYTTDASNFSASTFGISGLTGTNQVYDTVEDANLQVRVTTAGSFVSGSKYNTATVGVSAVNLDLEYENVFECKTVVQGYGIASATPSSDNIQNVTEGDTCTFVATLEQDCRFIGWYDNAEFTGTPLSTSSSFTYTPTAHTTLYPKGEIPNRVYIFSEAEEADKFTYTLNKSVAFVGDQVTLTVQITDDLYKFAGIYEADVEGHKLSNSLSNSLTYTFTMPSQDVYLFVDLGKEVKVYVTCYDCSLVGATSPIQSVVGKTETLTFTCDSSYDWSGIYSDAKCKNRITRDQVYTFMLESNDVYLYAKAIPKQQLYVKGQSGWETYSEVYRKENGVWVKKDDITDVFNTNTHYKRIAL